MIMWTIIFHSCQREKEYLPGGANGKESACQCRRCKFSPWVRKITWSRKWQPTPVFLAGEFHGQRILVHYRTWGCKSVSHTHTYSKCIENIEQNFPKCWEKFTPGTEILGDLFFFFSNTVMLESCSLKGHIVTI